MTREPPGLLALRDDVYRRLGRSYFQGIVPSEEHRQQWGAFGYHFGIAEVAPDDYSVQGKRNHGKSLGGYWSAAFDLGMGWSRSRSWLRWLISQCKAGFFPDLHGVIGSVDGKTQVYWSVENGWDGELYVSDFGDHRAHTHLEWWRDSVFRSQAAVLAGWPGWLPSPGPSPSPRPSPSRGPESHVEPRTSPSPPPRDPLEGLGPLGALTGLALGGLAWIIHRRMANGNP